MQTLNDLDRQGTALVRLDLNSPVIDGEVQDNKRFERHARTVEQLLDRGHPVAILAHQGRPGRDDFTTTRQHADILEQRLGQDVAYEDTIHASRARKHIQELRDGEVLMLENVRFLSEELRNEDPETHADSLLVKRLSREADFYVNDAFSAAHRSHASLVGFQPRMDSYAGQVMEEELTYIDQIRSRIDGRTVMLAGGAKPSDVLAVMEQFARDDVVDDFLLGGVVAKLFLREQGIETGDDRLVDSTFQDNRKKVRNLLDGYSDRIHLPIDMAAQESGERHETQTGELDSDTTYMDIGSQTIQQYRDRLQDADSILVKGGPGAFEDEPFQQGTEELLQAVAETDAFSVVGGGDTTNALDMLGIDTDRFDHVSIAGGAYIKRLLGNDLAAVQALEKYS
ncbi:MAG: phosphoglycerate kinase [Candidatus Nanohaloarchaea archaeon]|nr:phosphoglycerate kinase [Candidatus Nanohaloarchaea archaeon]